MKRQIFLFLSIAAGFVSASKGDEVVYSYNCTLVNEKGELVGKFPGGLCAYDDDGTVFASTQTMVFRFKKGDKPGWKKYFNSHHKLMIVDNQLLTMGSSVHKYKNELTRFDTLMFFDKEGSELRTFDFFVFADEILKNAKFKYDGKGRTFRTFQKPSPELPDDLKKSFTPVLNEFSHANSVFVLTENKISKSISAFKKGNFLVNMSGLGLILIVDQAFKKIIWYMKYPKGVRSMHDVQLNRTKDKIAYYNNRYTKNSSSIEEYDIFTSKRSILYKGNKELPFFGLPQGGFEFIEDDTLLISQFNADSKNRIFKVKNGKLIWDLEVFEMGKSGLPLEGLQEVRQLKQKNFL